MANFISSLSNSSSDGSLLGIPKGMIQLTLVIISKSVLNYDVQPETQQVDEPSKLYVGATLRLEPWVMY